MNSTSRATITTRSRRLPSGARRNAHHANGTRFSFNSAYAVDRPGPNVQQIPVPLADIRALAPLLRQGYVA